MLLALLRLGVANSAEVKLLVLVAKLVLYGFSFSKSVAVPLLLDKDEVFGLRVDLQFGGRVSRLKDFGSEHVRQPLHLDDAELLALDADDAIWALVGAEGGGALQRLVAQRRHRVLPTRVEEAEVRFVAEGEHCRPALDGNLMQADWELEAQELRTAVRHSSSDWVNDGSKKHSVVEADVKQQRRIHLCDQKRDWRTGQGLHTYSL